MVTTVKRQISKKTGAEYARLTLEDFHGTAEALVFPNTWSKLSRTIVPDAALLLTGSYSLRDRGEDRAPFIIDDAESLEALRDRGAVALQIGWRKDQAPSTDTAKAVVALCAAHPGPGPLYVEWSDGNGTTAHLRSRTLQVDLSEELVRELRRLLGEEHVQLVKAA